MLSKTIIVLLLLAIAFNLFRGLFFLVKEKKEGETDRVVNSLSWRIGLSILLFIMIFVLNYFGLVELHPLSPAPTQ
jgi:hypothetical protein